MQEYVRENFVKRQSFQRWVRNSLRQWLWCDQLYFSLRHVRNLHSSMGNVGQSMSAQPLLPIGDNGVGERAVFESLFFLTIGVRKWRCVIQINAMTTNECYRNFLVLFNRKKRVRMRQREWTERARGYLSCFLPVPQSYLLQATERERERKRERAFFYASFNSFPSAVFCSEETVRVLQLLLEVVGSDGLLAAGSPGAVLRG